MCKNENEFLENIETVDDALKWFDNPLKTKINYRGKIKGNSIFDEFSDEEIQNCKEQWLLTPEEYYSGLNGFDFDSSPEAWEHYRKHYSINTFGTATDDSEYSFSYLGFTKKDYYRLYAVSHNACEKKRKDQIEPSLSKRGPKQKQKGSFKADNCERLGGDTDFNFNSTLDKYKERLNGDYKGEMLLDKCSTMHHSLLNFSLVQAKGNMQVMKRPAYLDRADSLIYKLSSLLPIKEPRSFKESYLSNFDNIYDYCAKIYFLPTKNHHTGMMKNEKVSNKIAPLLDKEGSAWHNLLKSNTALINALITSGEKKFFKNTAENTNYNQELAKHYMVLAVQFWQAKEKYFELMDKIFEDEKKK